MKKANGLEIKYFVEDTMNDEGNRVFTSLEEVKDYLDELKDCEDEDYIEENVNVYSLENAVSMTVKADFRLEVK